MPTTTRRLPSQTLKSLLMQKCRLLLLSEGGANFVKPETFFLGSTYPERTLYEYVWLHKLMGEKQPPTVAGTVVFLLFPQYLERKRGGSWQHIIGPLLQYTRRKHIAASSVVQRPSGLKTGLLVCILSGEWFAPAASRKPETNTTLKEFETTTTSIIMQYTQYSMQCNYLEKVIPFSSTAKVYNIVSAAASREADEAEAVVIKVLILFVFLRFCKMLCSSIRHANATNFFISKLTVYSSYYVT